MNNAAAILNEPGTIAVIPTDTVYGVVARAADRTAVTRIYELKHRHQKPGTLIAANIDQLVSLGIPRRYLTAVEQFWPGAVSVVIPCSPELDYLSQNKRTLAIRIPDDAALTKLLSVTGPLITSSANQPGQPPANTITEANDYFGTDVDYYQDGGDLTNRQPSTVIRIVDDAVEVLRTGAVTIKPNGGKDDAR